MKKYLAKWTSYIVMICMITAFSSAVTGCNEEDMPFIKVNNGALELSSAAHKEVIEIKANTAWSVNSDATWCKITRGTGSLAGSFDIVIDENQGTASRSATVTVAGKDCSITVVVRQAGSDVNLEVSEENVEFYKNAESQKILVFSNHDWAVGSSKNWCTVSKSSGTNNGDFTISVTENDTNNPRSATVTISTTRNGQTFVKNITVNQGCVNAALIVSPNEKSVGSAREEFKVTIISSTKWIASVDSDWLTVDKNSGDGDDIVGITADVNNTNSERRGVVTFYTNDNGDKREVRTVTVTQRSVNAALIVSPEEKTVGSARGEFNVTVISTTGWNVSVDSDWLTVDKNSGNGNAIVGVTADVNNTTGDRRGVVTFYTNDNDKKEVRTVTVTQKSVNTALTVSPDEKTVGSAREEFNVSVISSTDWIASADSDWLTIDKTGGNGDDVVRITADVNNTNSRRTGIVTFYTSDNGDKKEICTVTVIQRIDKYYLEVPITEYLLSNGTQQFDVKYLLSGANCTVEASSNATWISSSVEDGYIDVEVDENTTQKERTAILSINTVGQSGAPIIKEVTIKQSATENILDILVSKVVLSPMGETLRVMLFTNANFDTQASSSWFSVTNGNDYIDITADMNATNMVREGYVTIYVTGTVGEQKSKAIKVTQNYADVKFEFNPSTYTFDYNQGSQSIILESTMGDWVMTNPIDDIPIWMTVAPTSGIGNSPINVAVTRNTYVRNRNYDLIFRNNLTGQSAILSVQQTKDPAIVLADYKYLGMGYDAAGEYAVDRYVRAQIFDWRKLEEKGYLAGVTSHNMTEESYLYGNTIAEYQSSMSLNANVSGGFSGFTASVKTNFSATSYSSSENEFATFRSVTQKQSVHLHTNVTAANLMECLTDEFMADVTTMSTDDLFLKYGTHVIGGFVMGGSLDYSMTADKSSMSSSVDMGIAVQAGYNYASAGINSGVEYNQYNSTKTQSSNFEEKLLVRGGQSQNASSFGSQAAHDQWLASLSESSTWVLVDYYGPKLFNIWDFAGSRKTEIEAAAGLWLAKDPFVPVSTHKTLRISATRLSYLLDDPGSEAEVVFQAYITVPPGSEAMFINFPQTDVPDQGGSYTFPSPYNTQSYSLSQQKAHSVVMRIVGFEDDTIGQDDFSGSLTLTYNPTTNTWSTPSGVISGSFTVSAYSNAEALRLYCTLSWQ